MTTDWTQTARLLKAIVIGLGVLILLGGALIVYEMISRSGKIGAPVSPDSYATTSLTLPSGARVVGMSGEGDYLSLLVEDAAGGQRVITIDVRSGAVLGILTLESTR